MRTKLWKVLLICFFIIIVISLVCMDTKAQLSSWPAAIADPYASIFAGFGISILPTLFGGIFGVTSLIDPTLQPFLFPSSTSFFPGYTYWYSYPFDYEWYEIWPYGIWGDDLWALQPFFGVTSFSPAFFLSPEPPWWTSALAFL